MAYQNIADKTEELLFYSSLCSPYTSLYKYYTAYLIAVYTR